MSDTMRDAHLSLDERIERAIKRIIRGEGHMRIPVEATDPDVVLSDCAAEIKTLRAAIEAAVAKERERCLDWIAAEARDCGCAARIAVAIERGE